MSSRTRRDAEERVEQARREAEDRLERLRLAWRAETGIAPSRRGWLLLLAAGAVGLAVGAAVVARRRRSLHR